MRQIYLPLSVTALGVLAACASSDPVTPAPAPVIVQPAPVVSAPPAVVVQQPGTVLAAPTAIRAGHGRIESITPMPQSAASGGTVRQLKRLGIKMDDGSVQFVDTPAEGLSVGERVELTTDGQLRR
ncbi:MAG TPA: hypothetical protein VNC62_12150 [Burkholderiales bacterium]|nr:hypothetical protein [Burkholderiales bacterium]